MSVNFKHTDEALRKFAKAVIKQARTRLTKEGHNVTSKLYKSLDYDLNVSKNSFSLLFEMMPYGDFIDKGVRGTKSSPVGTAKSPFKYKDSSNVIGMEYHTGTFAEWAKKKRIRLRDDKGKFKKGNYRSIGYVIARSVKERGIQPTFFFTKPFEQQFKNLPTQLIESFGLDAEQFLEFTNK
jgi:hypothetical protein